MQPQRIFLADDHLGFRDGLRQIDESHIFLDILLDVTSEAVIFLNEAQEIILFSSGAEEIFGYHQEEAIGQSIHILLPEIFQQIHADHILKFTESGVRSRLMNQSKGITGKRKNGEIFPAQASITQQMTDKGLVLAVNLRDTSKQIQLDERLRKLSVVVEQTPESVVITDTRGIIEYVNPAFETVTGFSSAEAIGKNPSILKSGLMPAEVYQAMWKTISSGEVWMGEICNKKKNGELFWELGTVSPIHNHAGEITNFISVKEDITARKKIEEELNRYRRQLEVLVDARTVELRSEIEERKRTESMLREKEQSLDLALRIGQLGSWEYDLHTGEISWADEVYRIFGLTPDEVKITYDAAMQMVHPDDQPVLAKAFADANADYQPFNIDLRIIRKDGLERIINLTCVPIIERLGDSKKMVGTVQDITDRVRVKAELLEKERMTKELDIGRSIQLQMLPKASPVVEGWEIAYFYQAAMEVGGDFYDFIKLPDEKIGMIVADVSGKGVPAALYMALSRAIVRTNALSGDAPDAVLLRSNEILYKDYLTDGFVSILYACLEPKTGIIEIANAGHCYPLLYSSHKAEVEIIETHGTVIGLLPKIPIPLLKLEMNPGDVFFCYTDGLSEAPNPVGEYYDDERVVEIFKANAQRPAAEILRAVVQSWHEFSGGLPQADDLTLIVVRRDPHLP